MKENYKFLDNINFPSDIRKLSENDLQRRNRIIKLLSDWGLVEIVKVSDVVDVAPLSQIKVIAYREKGEWILESKYNIGKKRQVSE